MNRTLLTVPMNWTFLAERKPVLLDGARQSGKSYLIERLFGPAAFARVVKLGFLKEPTLATFFESSLNPATIIENIELTFNIDFNPKTDRLFSMK